MNLILYVISKVFSINKYPFYLSYIYINYIWSIQLKLNKIVTLGKDIEWQGKPIITLEKGTQLTIGKSCRICSISSRTALGVNHSVIIRTLKEGAQIIIGSHVRISGTTICATDKIIIGDRCVIGANVTITDTDFHSLEPTIRSSVEDAKFAKSKPVIIGSDVFLGGGTYVLKGVTIGEGAVIGAGSVVTRNIKPFTISAGNPAKTIKDLNL